MKKTSRQDKAKKTHGKIKKTRGNVKKTYVKTKKAHGKIKNHDKIKKVIPKIPNPNIKKQQQNL